MSLCVTEKTTWNIAGLTKTEQEHPEGPIETQVQLETHQEDDDVLDIGLEVHGLSDDDHDCLFSGQCTAAAAPPSQDDTSFLKLYHRAAKKLEVNWPSLPLWESRALTLLDPHIMS